MLTFEDCVALGDLGETEVSAVARSEGLPAVSAAGYAGELHETAEGRDKLRRIYTACHEEAEASGDVATATALRDALHRLAATDDMNADDTNANAANGGRP